MKALRLTLFGFVLVALGICVWWYAQPGADLPEAETGRGVSRAPAATPSSGAPADYEALPTEQSAAPRRDRPVLAAEPKAAEASLAALLAEPNRFERQHALERLGYDASSAGLAAQRLAEITAPADRAAFIRGMFAKVAEGAPADALRALKDFRAWSDREAALGALVASWEKETRPESQVHAFTFAYETPEGRLLARLVGDPSLLVQATRELARGQDRAQLIKLAAMAETARDPQHALSFGQDLQGEERSNFLQTVALEWGRHRGEAALAWALQETDPALRARLQVEAIEGWGLSHPEEAARRLAEIADPAGRQEARQTIASQWGMIDTQAALQWANGLSDPADREHALASIQTSAPVGIGVVLASSPEGLPLVRDLVPGSPALAGGLLRSGYQIAAIGDGRGNFTSMQGVALDEVAKLIRGRPGTSAVLQVIPPGGSPANPWTISVPRRQLLFKAPPPTTP